MNEIKGLQLPDPGSVEAVYQPQDALGSAIKNTIAVGTAGLFVAAVQSTITKDNVGALGVFSKFGSTTAMFGWCICPDRCDRSTHSF